MPGGSLRELPIGELTTIAEHKFQLWKESPATPKNVNEELNRIIKAGNHLAEAAHRVQSEYDGIHRLRLALAEWYKARAE